MAADAAHPYAAVTDREYRRRIRAWALYDWANSAFATTILAAVLPIYYSQEAGATLPSAAIATRNWTITLSVSLVIVAILSPILGTVADVMRGKKKLLSLFVTVGVIGTGLLVLIQRGDWLLASMFLVVGRVGFSAANVFYDALLPHVAREEDRDLVSTRGYAAGYLGGGLLLAVNAVMIGVWGDTGGARLSFLSVAVWWAVFSIPLLRRVPEPPAASTSREPGVSALRVSLRRLGNTLRSIRRYRQLFRYLIAFLIYNDGIGTIIGVAAIYGAELGFGSVELILALLLVQFVGIPYSLVFGRIPSRNVRRRGLFLAFVVFNIVALPVVGIAAARVLDPEVVGAPPAPFESIAGAVGEGSYEVDDPAIAYEGSWTVRSRSELGTGANTDHAVTAVAGDAYELRFHGQEVRLTHSIGPDHGIWEVEVDGRPLLEDGDPVTIDAYNSTILYGSETTIDAGTPDEHRLRVINTGERAAESTGTVMTLAGAEVLAGRRVSNLALIFGGLLALEAVGLALSAMVGSAVFDRLADAMTTKRTIILALVVYSVIAVWGFFLDAVVEFWFLAWMVAMVQGGSQALSRSLYAAMSPAAESGEFFGLFSVMSKFSAILGPLIFAGAVAAFDSSRPAILSIVALFIVGIVLLLRVDVAEGRAVARRADAELMGGDGDAGRKHPGQR